MQSVHPQMSIWLQSTPKVVPTTERLLSRATGNQKSVWRFNLADTPVKSRILNEEFASSALTRSEAATTIKTDGMGIDSMTTIVKKEKQLKTSKRRRLTSYFALANCKSCLIPFLQGLIIGILTGGIILAAILPPIFLTGKSTTTAIVVQAFFTIGTGTTTSTGAGITTLTGAGTTTSTGAGTTISTTTKTISCAKPTSNSLRSFFPDNKNTLYTANFTATKTSLLFAIGINTTSSGAVFIDDVSIVDIAMRSVQLISNGGFENSTTTWTFWNLTCAVSCTGSQNGGTIVTSGCGGNGNNCFEGSCTNEQLFLQQELSATVGHNYEITMTIEKTGLGGTVDTYVY